MTIVGSNAPPRKGPVLQRALFLVIVAFIMLLVGFVAPGWTYIEVVYKGASYHEGLWYTVVCSELGGCYTHFLMGPFSSVGNFRVLQFLCPVALVFAIVSLIMTIINKRPSSIRLKGSTAACLFFAGLFAIIPAAKHGDDMREYESRSLGKTFQFPYALFIFGLGGVVMMAAFILVLIDLYQCWVHREDEHPSNIQENSAPRPYLSFNMSNQYPSGNSFTNSGQNPIMDQYSNRDPYPAKDRSSCRDAYPIGYSYPSNHSYPSKDSYPSKATRY